jgi:hypothetical protein
MVMAVLRSRSRPGQADAQRSSSSDETGTVSGANHYGKCIAKEIIWQYVVAP